MKKTTYFLILYIIMSVGALFILSAEPGEKKRFWDHGEDNLIDGMIASMDDRELLGQTFFLGYQGDKVPAYLLEWIKERSIGGIKLFTRNIKNLQAVAGDISLMQEQAALSPSGTPLFVATDQEGGWVRHVRGGTLHTSGNLALGAADLPRDAYLTGLYIGRELSFLGFNMNYAPTVDIYSNPANTGIGPRAFSSDPVTTGLLGVAYFKGMDEAGIICTAKHFPGHGGATEDSHGYLPEVLIDLETMMNREMVPYRFLIKEGLPAIMTGHIAFPEITGNSTAATLSPFFMQEVLRKKLGFEGVLVTDSLKMGGVRKGIDVFSEVTRRAIMAGNDMVLIPHSKTRQRESWDRLTGLMNEDRAFKARVTESARRILKQKMRYFRGEKPIPVYPDVKNVYKFLALLQETEFRDFTFQTACRSVTRIKGREIPYKQQKREKLLIVGQYRNFLRQGLIRYPDAATQDFSYYPHAFSTEKIRNAVTARAKKYDTLIFCLANANSFEVLKALRKYNKKIIVISTLTPAYLKDLPWIETAIAVYGTAPESFAAGFAALAGDFVPRGKLPLDLEGE